MISPMIELTEVDLKEFLDMCTDSYAATNPYLIYNIQTPEEFRVET